MGAGAQAAIVFGSAYVGISSAVLTLLILILSEILPKTLGAVYWRALAPPVTSILGPLVWILSPLVVVSRAITRLLARDNNEAIIQPEEISAMAALGEQQGILDGSESSMLKNTLRLRELKVKEIMTPRTVVFSLCEEHSIDEVMSEFEDLEFSCIPVCAENREDLSGYVLKDEILLHAAKGQGSISLSQIKREFLSVSEEEPLTSMLKNLIEGLGIIAYVVGGIIGLGGCIVLILGNVVGSMVVPDYNWIADTVSDFGAGQYERIQDFALYSYLVYALGVLFAVAPLLTAGGMGQTASRYKWIAIGCAVLWMLTAPVFFFLPTGIDGVYERGLGLISIVWVVTLSWLLVKAGQSAKARANQ